MYLNYLHLMDFTLLTFSFFHLFTLPSLSLESEKSDSMQSDGKVMAK